MELLKVKSYMDLIHLAKPKEVAAVANKWAIFCLSKGIQFTEMEAAKDFFDILGALVMQDDIPDQHVFARCLQTIHLPEAECIQVRRIFLE